MHSKINNIKYISRDGSRKKENDTTNNFSKQMNSNFLKSNQNYFNNNFNIKSMNLKDNNNPMNRHQRYKSQNIEINTDFNKLQGAAAEENKNNIFGKFSPINTKDFNGINIKSNFNLGNSNIGNFTSNNFNFGGNNKFIKCKII